MLIDKKLVKRHFDKHAHEYDQFASLQQRMATHLLRVVAQQIPAKQVRRILEIGCGTGFLTRLLAEHFPEAHIVTLDISEAMIQQTQHKLTAFSNRITFLAEDAEVVDNALMQRVAGDQPFDLIISNAVFQWFNHHERTLSFYLRYLHPQHGVFGFSTFGPNTFRELHHSFQAAEAELGLESSAHGQTFIPHDQWSKWFSVGQSQAKFQWMAVEQLEYYDHVKQFLTQIKRIGAGNAVASKRSIGGKQLFTKMIQHYDTRYSTPNGIQVTYDIGYGICTMI